MNKRLHQLHTELEKGRQRIRALDHERQELRDTMLRISGAIRVLEEMLAQQDGDREEADAALSTVA
jgi:septal ring factor EnvC (AmiA/AmiB activator)